MGNLGEALDSWILHGPAQTIAAIWDIGGETSGSEDLSLFSSPPFSSSVNLHFK